MSEKRRDQKSLADFFNDERSSKTKKRLLEKTNLKFFVHSVKIPTTKNDFLNRLSTTENQLKEDKKIYIG